MTIAIINGGAFHNLSRIVIADFYQTLVSTLQSSQILNNKAQKIGQRVYEIFLQESYWFSKAMVMPGEARGEDIGMKARMR